MGKRHFILDDDVEDLIAPFHRKKGDLSRIINEALRQKYREGNIIENATVLSVSGYETIKLDKPITVKAGTSISDYPELVEAIHKASKKQYGDKKQ